MRRKKKEKVKEMTEDEIAEFKQQYVAMLDNDKQYSLEVDPENKYNMAELQKLFIYHYVNTKSLPLAAQFAGIDEETARFYFSMYSTQQEVRRMNLAMYQRQFAQKMLSVEQLGGYLTSLLIDEGVPLADRLQTKDKLTVVRMLLDLNAYKKEQMANPDNIIDFTVEEERQIKELDVTSIKKMLQEINKPKDLERLKIIDEIKEASTTKFTVEEEAFLYTLEKEELISLLETIKGGNKH